MNKRSMMNSYYNEIELHRSELSLKYGIEDGSITLSGDRISGKTYDAKTAIKAYFAAAWDSASKSWIVKKDLVFAQNIFANGLEV